MSGSATSALLQRCDGVEAPARRQHRHINVAEGQAAGRRSGQHMQEPNRDLHTEELRSSGAEKVAAAAVAFTAGATGEEGETPVALYGTALGSWISARACRVPITPASSTSGQRQSSPVFSPAAGSPPSGAGDSFASGETPHLVHQKATRAADVDGRGAKVPAATEMSAEVVELRRQVAAEGLSTEQLESMLTYLRQGPRSPTREDEERTMRFLSGVVPLEKMTVVTTIFKIIYAEGSVKQCKRFI
jgi:hypothetical protein